MKPTPRDIQIGTRRIGRHCPPFIVAEMSCNHGQSLERAEAIIRAAAEAGADAVKLQTLTPDSITLDVDRDEFLIDDPKSLWHGKRLHSLYREAYTPWEWHAPLFELCRRLGLVPFSTPFSRDAVDFLETLGNPLYKISSFENVDLPLIRRAAQTGKPVVISTGMASRDELQEAVDAARQAGAQDVILLKCTSAYPAPPDEANLATLADMKERFGCHVGISDHTLGLGVALQSIALGGVFIEKHFTLSRADPTLDAAFSLEPAEMKQLVEEARQGASSIGEVRYGPTSREAGSAAFRRSIYVAKDLREGEVLTAENTAIVRPAKGLAPKHYEAILGRRVKSAVKRGTPLQWDLLS